MKTLYFECGMGAAGDMLTAALIDLYDDPGQIIEKLNSIGIPKVKYILEDSEKCGIKGKHVRVIVDGVEETSDDVNTHSAHTHEHNTCKNAHAHHHSSMRDIENIIENLDVDDVVKENAAGVYRNIAEAESKVHGKTMDEIHFHEVGTMDAVADIVAVCYLINELDPEMIIASPVRTGYGHVHCAHGILPVPAPATELLLRNVPVYAGDIEGEFCTPTGAALLKYFIEKYENMPVMCVKNTGYGMGSKDFGIANCLRAYIGEMAEEDDESQYDPNRDQIIELRCNLDDMTPEDIGYVTELLMREGALDVYTLNINMKKNRPAIMLCCMCRVNRKGKFIRLIFKHTSTIGIREYECNRSILSREDVMVDTRYGEVRAKKSSGYGTERIKLEYEDLVRIADKNGLPLSQLRKDIPK